MMDEAPGSWAGCTGMGVPVNRRLVELMGGDIGVDSGPAGCGFWIELGIPAADGQPKASDAVPQNEGESARVPDGRAHNAEAFARPLESETPMHMPLPEQVEELYRLSMIGNMRAIREHALGLAEQDAGLVTFAWHIATLAEHFESRAIVELMRGLQERPQGPEGTGVSEEAARTPGAYSGGAVGEETS